jgi:hypothetical protein
VRGACAKINNEFIYSQDARAPVSLIQCIAEELLMGRPAFEVGLCTRKVRIRPSAVVANYLLAISRNLQLTSDDNCYGRISTNI